MTVSVHKPKTRFKPTALKATRGGAKYYPGTFPEYFMDRRFIRWVESGWCGTGAGKVRPPVHLKNVFINYFLSIVTRNSLISLSKIDINFTSLIAATRCRRYGVLITKEKDKHISRL